MKRFVLIAMFLTFAGRSASQQTVTKSKGTAAQIKDKQITEKSVAPKQDHPPECIAEPTSQTKTAPRASPAAEHSADIEIQGKLARFTFWLVVVGGLQFIALIAQAVVFYRTLRAINRQVSEMQEQRGDTHGLAEQATRQTELTRAQLELSHRPWVSVDVGIASNLVFDQRGATLMLNVKMTNVGHSVAKYVSLWTEFVVLGIHNLNEAHEKLCDIMKQPVNQKSDYGWLLFPGQQVVESRGVIASPQDIAKALEAPAFQGMKAIGLHLIGCVDYQSTFDPTKRHQTRFVYLVGRIDQQRGMVMGAFDPSINFHPNIVITPTMHGTSAD
jgi:hypothetical protein